ADATPGDHAGAVLASNPTIGFGDQEQVVTTDRRTGTRVFVRVDGPLTSSVSVQNLAASYSPAPNPLDGSVEMSYRVQNSGNVRVSGTALASASGPFGLTSTSAEGHTFVDLLPGEGFDVKVKITGVAATVLVKTKVHLENLQQGDGGAIEPVAQSKTI